MLLDHKQLAIQDPDVVEATLEKFRTNKGVNFSDPILEIARKNGHVPLGASISILLALRACNTDPPQH